VPCPSRGRAQICVEADPSVSEIRGPAKMPIPVKIGSSTVEVPTPLAVGAALATPFVLRSAVGALRGPPAVLKNGRFKGCALPPGAFDALIVGGGPSGSTCAYYFAQVRPRRRSSSRPRSSVRRNPGEPPTPPGSLDLLSTARGSPAAQTAACVRLAHVVWSSAATSPGLPVPGLPRSGPSARPPSLPSTTDALRPRLHSTPASTPGGWLRGGA
jgi:hypothetical protein